jgi:hypothetical protein
METTKSDFLGFVGKLWPLLALLGLVGSVIWYVVSLDWRVRDVDIRIRALEERIHTQAIVSTLPSTPTPEGKNPKLEGSTILTAEPKPNPVARACDSLADQVANDMKAGLTSTARDKRQMMLSLGCLPPSQRE